MRTPFHFTNETSTSTRSADASSRRTSLPTRRSRGSIHQQIAMAERKGRAHELARPEPRIGDHAHREQELARLEQQGLAAAELRTLRRDLDAIEARLNDQTREAR